MVIVQISSFNFQSGSDQTAKNINGSSFQNLPLLGGPCLDADFILTLWKLPETFSSAGEMIMIIAWANKSWAFKTSNPAGSQSLCGERVSYEIIHSISLCILDYFTPCFLFMWLLLLFNKTVFEYVPLNRVYNTKWSNQTKATLFSKNNTVFKCCKFLKGSKK